VGRFPWASLERLAAGTGEPDDECHVVVAPEGYVGGYVWRGPHFWTVRSLARQLLDDLLLAEAVAGDLPSARAVLALCRAWGSAVAATRGTPLRAVTLGLAPEGPVAAAARRADAVLMQRYARCGRSMARVLDAERLVTALAPELARRWSDGGSPYHGAIVLATDAGTVGLRLGPRGLAVTAPPAGGAEQAETVRVPQWTLAQLALGAYPPDEILDAAGVAVTGGVQEALEVLFPPRHPHMFVPDRF
jgi:hypothetical protein